MSRGPKEALVVILDVGQTMASNPARLAGALKAVGMLIQQKVWNALSMLPNHLRKFCVIDSVQS